MADEKISIAVIIPSFNRVKQTQRAIDSVLQQTYPVNEIIVVDDGSDTVFKTDSPNVTVLRLKKNLGAAAARNEAIAKCKSTWVAQLDSDDIWHPNRIESIQETLFALPKNTVLGSGFNYIDPSRNRSKATIPPAANEVTDFAKGCWFCPGSCCVFRKTDFDAIGPYNKDMRRLEDYEWFLRFASQGGSLQIHPEVSVDIHKGSRPKHPLIADARKEIDPLLNDLDIKSRRYGRAFLDLEEATAYGYSGQYIKTLFALARSFFNHPRLRLQPVKM